MAARATSLLLLIMGLARHLRACTPTGRSCKLGARNIVTWWAGKPIKRLQLASYWDEELRTFQLMFCVLKSSLGEAR